MNEELRISIRQWVQNYADLRIEGISAENRIPLIFKRAHTLRVAADASQIAAELGWDQNDVMVAESAALLHDIARFEQYRLYSTFDDSRSFDHGEHGREIACECAQLSACSDEDREAILMSVQFHNRREIPGSLEGRALRHLKLIRDADKVDILHSVSLILREDWHTQHPGILLDVDCDGPLTPELVTELLENNSGQYKNVRTLLDLHLMRIAWVYSISYIPALRMLVERQLYADAIAALPQTKDVRTICERALSHIERALTAG